MTIDEILSHPGVCLVIYGGKVYNYKGMWNGKLNGSTEGTKLEIEVRECDTLDELLEQLAAKWTKLVERGTPVFTGPLIEHTTDDIPF